MQIKYLGHAAFLITSEKGIKIITDPYQTSNQLSYGGIQESADIVTVSHDHSDHNNAASVKGNPVLVKKEGTVEVKGIKFKGIPCYHDEVKGKARGNNIIFCFEVDGMRVCHLGDLGHSLSDTQVNELGEIDILLIPVGGFYTIDAGMASMVSDDLKPKVIIPMHYKTPKCNWPLNTVEDFLAGKKNVKKLNSSEVEFKADKLPQITEIIVLQAAL